MNGLFFKCTYDDVTMAQSEKFAGVRLPGRKGEPRRFRQRYEWIMENAEEKWVEFRCWAMSEVHKELQEALAQRAPGAKYFLFDYFGMAFYNEVMDMDPLDLVRRMCSDPKYYTNVPGLVYCPYAPTLDGGQYKEYAHGMAPKELAVKCAQFGRNEGFFTVCDTGLECGRYLHRQFFETFIRSDPARPWLFEHGAHMPGRKGWLAHNTYPLPNGRNWFADFAVLLAHAAPNFISWMWCDGSYPSGHFDEMREFAAGYRQLPLGLYKTVGKDGSVFFRASDKAFYVVEIEGRGQDCDLPPSLGAGSYRDVVTGEPLGGSTAAPARLSVRPYEFRVFVKQ